MSQVEHLYQFPAPRRSSTLKELCELTEVGNSQVNSKDHLEDQEPRFSLVLNFSASDGKEGSTKAESHGVHLNPKIRVYIFNLFPTALHILCPGKRLVIVSFDHAINALQPGFISDTFWVGLVNGEIYYITSDLFFDQKIKGRVQAGKFEGLTGINSRRTIKIKLNRESDNFIFSKLGVSMIKETRCYGQDVQPSDPLSSSKTAALSRVYLLVYSREIFPVSLGDATQGLDHEKLSVFYLNPGESKNLMLPELKIHLYAESRPRWLHWTNWILLNPWLPLVKNGVLEKGLEKKRPWFSPMMSEWDSRVAALKLKPTDNLFAHLVATKCGIVYIELTKISFEPINDQVQIHQTLLVEIIWSMPETILSIGFDEAMFSLVIISSSGISVMLEPNIQQGSTNGWLPISRIALPLKQKLKDWTAFQRDGANYFALVDGLGSLHFIQVGEKVLVSSGRYEMLDFKFILQDTCNSPLLWPNSYQDMKESDGSLLGVTIAGTLLKIKNEPLKNLSAHSTTANCLSQLNGFASEANILKERDEELDTQLDILRKSLEFAYLLHTQPDMLQIEMIPFMEELSLNVSGASQIAIKITLKSAHDVPIQIPSGWSMYLKFRPLVLFKSGVSNNEMLVSSEASFSLPTKLTESCDWNYRLSNIQPLLPIAVECGLKFFLPQEDQNEPSGYYRGSSIPLCNQTLDMLHFSILDTKDRPQNPRGYILDDITHAKLNVPYHTTHPFHAFNLNASMLNIFKGDSAEEDVLKLFQQTNSVSTILKIDCINTLRVDRETLLEFNSGDNFLYYLVLGEVILHDQPKNSIELSLPGFLMGSKHFLEGVTFEIIDSLTQGNKSIWELKIATTSYLGLLHILDSLYRRLSSQPFEYKLVSALDEDIGMAWQNYVANLSMNPDHSFEDLLKGCIESFLVYKLDKASSQ